jgi:hypothetical protein
VRSLTPQCWDRFDFYASLVLFLFSDDMGKINAQLISAIAGSFKLVRPGAMLPNLRKISVIIWKESYLLPLFLSPELIESSFRGRPMPRLDFVSALELDCRPSGDVGWSTAIWQMMQQARTRLQYLSLSGAYIKPAIVTEEGCFTQLRVLKLQNWHRDFSIVPISPNMLHTLILVDCWIQSDCDLCLLLRQHSMTLRRICLGGLGLRGTESTKAYADFFAKCMGLLPRLEEIHLLQTQLTFTVLPLYVLLLHVPPSVVSVYFETHQTRTVFDECHRPRATTDRQRGGFAKSRLDSASST